MALWPKEKCHYIASDFLFSAKRESGFLHVLRVSSTNKTDYHDITEILLKVALNTINPNPKRKEKKTNKIGKTIHRKD